MRLAPNQSASKSYWFLSAMPSGSFCQPYCHRLGVFTTSYLNNWIASLLPVSPASPVKNIMSQSGYLLPPHPPPQNHQQVSPILLLSNPWRLSTHLHLPLTPTHSTFPDGTMGGTSRLVPVSTLVLVQSTLPAPLPEKASKTENLSMLPPTLLTGLEMRTKSLNMT